jgi:hypothetical protein
MVSMMVTKLTTIDEY